MNEFLKAAMESGVTDVHFIHDGVYVRKNGKLDKVADVQWTAADLLAFFQHQDVAVQDDFAVSLFGRRVRVHRYQTYHGPAWALRFLPGQVPDLQGLHLPDQLVRLATEKSGLILLTGPTGSGKSTSLAAMLKHRAAAGGHLMTFERPVEYLLASDEALITQTELTADEALAPLLAAALRADPDVIMVGEIRTAEAAKGVLYLAETGHLVMTTLHSADVVQALMRLVHLIDAEERPLWQGILAEVLRGVVAQTLISSPLTDGLIPVAEVLLQSEGLARQIRDGAWSLIAQSLENQGGGLSFEAHLANHVQRGLLDAADAFQLARHPERLTILLGMS